MREDDLPGLGSDCFNQLVGCRTGPMLFNRNDIYVGESLRRYGEFSAGESEVFRQTVQAGMTVLEVGANIGAHTVELSRLAGPGGTVHAFEPQRLVFQTLCANLALNGCANVHAHPAAAGAESGWLVVPPTDPCQRTNFGGIALHEAGPGERVRVMTIDEMLLPACHVIKIDAEGMEEPVLRGAPGTIARHRPLLYVENDREDRSARLISCIAGYAYRMFWHLPPLYSPNNFRNDPENVFPGLLSMNLLCVPAESALKVEGLPEVTGPEDSWRAALGRASRPGGRIGGGAASSRRFDPGLWAWGGRGILHCTITRGDIPCAKRLTI